MKHFLHLLPAIFFSLISLGQSQPEQQISFVKEQKTHAYYIKQADLWWQNLEKDKGDENAWYNYYRACRNAQATANWSTDFVNEGPNLRLGEDIVELIEKHIPNSFTYHFIKGSTGGVSPDAGEHLMKAYKMNPDFPGILPNVITYATSIHNPDLRKEANKRWFAHNDLPVSLMNYGYNMLQSVEPNGILLTQHDNDTYPVWMLQDAKSLRTDVLVINIDFLLHEGFREVIFDKLDIPPFQLDKIDINEYETNWKNVVEHFLGTYKGEQTVHISQTVSSQWYEKFENDLQICGLTKTFKDRPIDNVKLLEDRFLLDYLAFNFQDHPMQFRVDEMNLNYLPYFAKIIEHKQDLTPARQQEIRIQAFHILDNLDNSAEFEQYRKIFRE